MILMKKTPNIHSTDLGVHELSYFSVLDIEVLPLGPMVLDGNNHHIINTTIFTFFKRIFFSFDHGSSQKDILLQNDCIYLLFSTGRRSLAKHQ